MPKSNHPIETTAHIQLSLDERIKANICDIINREPELQDFDIKVQITNGIVSLAGAVESRHIKRLAENIISDVPGVNDVNNNLRIDTTIASKGTTHSLRK